MKMLITTACLLVAEGVASHADIGDTAELSKDDAITLARMGRALYLEKSDDPTKGQLTAAAEDKARVKKQAAAIAAEHEQRATDAQVQSPTGMAALIASSVAAAVQAALAPKPNAPL